MRQDKFGWADKQRRAAQVLSLLKSLVQKYKFWRRRCSSLLRLNSCWHKSTNALLVQKYKYSLTQKTLLAAPSLRQQRRGGSKAYSLYLLYKSTNTDTRGAAGTTKKQLAAAKERRIKSMQTKRATVRGLDPAEKAVISIMNALAMHWSVGGLQVLSLLALLVQKGFH
jgi:hypothetical protein